MTHVHPSLLFQILAPPRLVEFPGLCSRSLLVFYFYMWSCVSVNPNLLIYALLPRSPTGTHKFDFNNWECVSIFVNPSFCIIFYYIPKMRVPAYAVCLSVRRPSLKMITSRCFRVAARGTRSQIIFFKQPFMCCCLSPSFLRNSDKAGRPHDGRYHETKNVYLCVTGSPRCRVEAGTTL